MKKNIIPIVVTTFLFFVPPASLLRAANTVTIQSSNPDSNGDGITGDDIIDDIAAFDFIGEDIFVTSGAVSSLLQSSSLDIAAATSVTVADEVAWSANTTFSLDAPSVILTAPIAGAGSTSVLNVSGTLTLQSLTKAISIDTFAPSGSLTVQGSGLGLPVGSSYDLFDINSFSTSFTSINLPSLDVGKSWDLTDLYTTGEISVIPETSSALLIGAVAICFACSRRRNK